MKFSSKRMVRPIALAYMFVATSFLVNPSDIRCDQPQTLRDIIGHDSFDKTVPEKLARQKGTYNLGSLHEPTQQLKAIYRKKLDEKTDPELAWQLATIVRDQLANTSLTWAAPTDMSRRKSNREDSNENFETLASLLQICFENSKHDSELWKNSGLSLAKLRLMQGDWDGMNQMLEKLGQEPVPAKRRPDLPAPPVDWKNLKQDWQVSEPSMRSGSCGVEFRFVRRGKPLRGLPGVHVLVKRAPEPKKGFFSGIKVDTLHHATQPMLAEPYESFGYLAQDRNQTRYGVSDKNGVVRIEGLPKVPVVVEVLVPTGNFTESGSTWDLLIETPDGLKPADRGDPTAIDTHKPPAKLELQEGELVRYPVVFVQSRIESTMQDWTPVSRQFVLKWDESNELDADAFNVKLTLSALSQHPDMPKMSPRLATESIRVTDRSWPLGEKGIGKLQLIPGNFYIVEIEALKNETIVATLPWQRVWVPWAHRKSQPPRKSGIGDGHGPIFYHDIWLRTSANGQPLEKRLPNQIKNSSEDFETEYNRLGMAWLDMHKQKPNSVKDLQKLADELPEGNVVKIAAESLLELNRHGEPPPKRFYFKAEKSND